MQVYTELGLTEWRVNSSTITGAWKKEALQWHPDKVSEEMKDHATRKMQRLNAVKEMLLDPNKRYQYHLNGRVPWSV